MTKVAELVEWFFILTAVAYNLVRIPRKSPSGVSECEAVAIETIEKFGRETGFFGSLLV